MIIDYRIKCVILLGYRHRFALTRRTWWVQSSGWTPKCFIDVVIVSTPKLANKTTPELKGRVICLTFLQHLYYDRLKTVFPNPYCYEICLYKNGNQFNVFYLLLLNLQVYKYSY